MWSSLAILLALLGQAEGGDGQMQGDIVDICYGPPPSCGPPAFQRAIVVKTTVDVSACPPPPELPNEKDIFPEAIFIEAHRVRFEDGVTPGVLDLRAFAVIQRRFGGHGGFVSGELCTYTIASAITGQYALVLGDVNPNKTAFRWVRAYIRPSLMPGTWCDFDYDGDVDRDDWLTFFGRSVFGRSGDDGKK